MASSVSMKRVLVPVADGSEEIETVSIVDTLRRAGAEVTLASISASISCILMPSVCNMASPHQHTGRGVRLIADSLIEDVSDIEYDCIALPGGMPGAQRMRDSVVLCDMLQRQHARKAWVSAVCASPAVVLASLNILTADSKATCHPNFVDRLPNKESAEQVAVTHGNIITSRGPGTSIIFALKIIESLFGVEKAKEVAKPMLVAGCDL